MLYYVIHHCSAYPYERLSLTLTGSRFLWICAGTSCPPASPMDAHTSNASSATKAPRSPPSTMLPWTITDIRLVSKVKPAAYTGAFTSPDAELESVYYTAAYGVHNNMHTDRFGSILIDRGDRTAYQGDGHPTMAAAAAVFGSKATFALLRSALNLTDTACDGCSGKAPLASGSYPLYWTLSLSEWYLSSGDAEGFLAMAPDVARVLDKQYSNYNESFPK